MLGTMRPMEPRDLAGAVFREEDEAECRAAGGECCAKGIEAAPHVDVVLEPGTGKPFAFFGLVPVDDVSGLVWMLATPALARNARTLHAHTPSVIDAWHSRCPLLFNFVDARNSLHIRWLRRLGFTFIKLHPKWGHEQRPFYEFVRIPHV